MVYVPPVGAVVRFPCEPASAARVGALGVSFVEGIGATVAQIPCDLSSELFDAASARARVDRLDDVLVVDLHSNALRLVDETPSHHLAVDPRGRPYVWREPRLESTTLAPLRLPSRVESAGDLEAHLATWVQQLEAVDPDQLAQSRARWWEQLRRIERRAASRAEEVRPLASADDCVQLDRALDSIRRRILYGTDPENDFEVDPYDGKAWAPGRDFYINQAVDRIFDLADELSQALADRDRQESVRGEVERLVSAHLDEMPERIQMVVQAGMLSQSIGAARAALLELLQPGWKWADDDVKEAMNPPTAALQALLAAHEIDPGVTLAFKPGPRRGTGRYILISGFLGRRIMAELEVMPGTTA